MSIGEVDDRQPAHWNYPNGPPRGAEPSSAGDPNPSHNAHPSDPQRPPNHYASYPPPQQQQGYPVHSPYQQHPNGQLPSHQQHGPPDMLTLPPPPQVGHDMYRGQHAGPPPPHYDHAYAQQGQPMNYPSQAQQSAVTFNQPAPRQRTAIACRYCRRRKIRCHGFDQNPEGRCSNCVRFNQECIFTPVSSQTHAFVPAHTAYPHLRNQGRMPQTSDGRPMYPQQGGPPLYGAHGQPLGPVPPPAHSDAHYPPPPGPSQPYGAPAPYPTAPSYDARGPPHHAPAHDDQNRRTSSGYDHHPDHMTPISPASTTNGHSYQGPYYSQPPPNGQHAAPAQVPTPTTQPRTSPMSNYSYDARRGGSTSPHGSVNAGPGASYGPYPGNLHPPQVLPPNNDGRNPSPAGQPRENGRSNGMRVHDMLDNSNSQGGRSNTDSNMLGLLNKRAP